MTKCLEYIILIKDCPGKQVKILYEPVSVRHKIYSLLCIPEWDLSGRIAREICAPV